MLSMRTRIWVPVFVVNVTHVSIHVTRVPGTIAFANEAIVKLDHAIVSS